MPSAFTITFSDEITLWLRVKARELDIAVEALVAEIVEDVAAQAAELTWQEGDPLASLHSLKAWPGRMIAISALWQSWCALAQESTQEDFANGISWLIERGFLETSQAGESIHVCLTVLGYELTSQHACASDQAEVRLQSPWISRRPARRRRSNFVRSAARGLTRTSGKLRLASSQQRTSVEAFLPIAPEAGNYS